MSSKFDEVIDHLIERTAKGQVNWESTADEDEFLVFFQDYSLSLRTGIDEDEDEFVAIALRSQNGQTIESNYFWDKMSDKGMWAKASSLFSAARRKALGIEQAFEKVLKEMETKPVIGRTPGKQK